MTKTLGQVAAEAFAACHPMSDPWQAAAEAVVKADRERNWPEPWRTNGKYQAVIEAAKALCAALDCRSMEELADVPHWLRKTIEPLELAVEALEEVEDD